MDDPTWLLRERTRRHFFGGCGIGVGSLALGSLIAAERTAAAEPTAPPVDPAAGPLAVRPPHFAPRAKRVIFLFMAGGPSQLDLFDWKPELARRDGQPIPASFVEGKRFAFMNSSHRVDLLASKRSFARHGASGAWVSDLLPHTAGIVDRLCIVRTCSADLFNHAPAKLFMNTGTGQFGRPSMGAWVTYGLGSESSDLPGFVVLQSGPRGPRGGAVLWGSGSLPSGYQGVPLRSTGDAILNLSPPPGVAAAAQHRVIDAVGRLNRRRLSATGDAEIATRIAGYEMAYRMQSSAPELMDIGGESAETLALYGIRSPAEATYARNCLLARRLVERGVRFVQLIDGGWDHHSKLYADLPTKCAEMDRSLAALVEDLEQRGLLDETLVIWAGEFGRTPMLEGKPDPKLVGRDHHKDAFTIWMAGGGLKRGFSYGATCELGYRITERPVAVHDLQATILHLLGLNHEALTFRFQGRDFRLTDVHGEVVKDLLA